jgi:cell division septation protein DedD
MWVKSDSATTSSSTSNVSNNTQTQVPQNTSSIDSVQARPEDDRQKPGTNRASAIMSPSINTQAPIAKLTRPSIGTWFVVAGSYTRYEADKANQRLSYIRSLGYDANLVDSNNYPGFKGGLNCVVIGPYSKADAKNLLARMKFSVADAYIKSGW